MGCNIHDSVMNEPEREEIDNLLNGSFCTLCGSRNQDCGCDDLNTSSDEGDSVYDMTNNWVTAGGLLAPTNRFSNLLRAYFFMTKNNSIGDYYYQRWLQEGVYWSMCGLNQLGTHRLSKTDEYHIWQTMKARCYNPNNHKYKRYGGRGIAVCDRWLQSFENFIADMGKRPSTSHSLDRINNDGDYTPQNCRWATPKEQARNTQTNRLITLNGVTRTLVEWREYYGLSVTQLEYRMYHAGWSAEKALTTPYIRYQRLATCKGTEIK